jgi:hypothetical protein
MWSSKARPRLSLLRCGLLALTLVAPLALASCTSFRPVYGENGAIGRRLEVSYNKPATRLDQIIIQDLALRLGNSQRDEDVPKVSINAYAGSRALTRTAVSKPATQYEVAVTANYSVTDAEGEVLVSGSRRAVASYTTVGQVLADEEAYKDAVERAGHEVAETIRLSILGQLASPVREAALEDE